MRDVPNGNRKSSLFPALGFGLGLRSDHYAEVLKGRSPDVSWFEVVTENFMGDGGRPLQILEKVRENHPLALHGVSLSIGSTDPLAKSYLDRLRALIDRFQPELVSDHCCWTGVEGENIHDLLPLPFTEEAIRHVVARVSRVQDRIGRRILIENVSSYITYAHSEMTEWEFLAEIARRADCGILMDVNNVYVSSINHGFDPLKFLDGIPRERVGQMHLAGHSTDQLENGRVFLIDTHDCAVCPEVWALYEQAVRRYGAVSTMVEWDAEIPAYEVLRQELAKARALEEKVLGSHSNGAVARAAAAANASDHHPVRA